jgi:hypothetical protein
MSFVREKWDSLASQLPSNPQLTTSVLNRLQTALSRHFFGFFAVGGFFSPPPGLMSARKSLALNG